MRCALPPDGRGAVRRLAGGDNLFLPHGVQVQAALDAAAPFREELMRRGVFVVPLPIFGEGWGSALERGVFGY